MKADTDARPTQTTPDRPSSVRSDDLLAYTAICETCGGLMQRSNRLGRQTRTEYCCKDCAREGRWRRRHDGFMFPVPDTFEDAFLWEYDGYAPSDWFGE